MLKELLDWAKGQPFNNILTAAMLGMIAWIGYYGISFAIPDHIKTIQAGYERIEAAHEKRLATDREEHRESLKSQQATFERTIDRIVGERPLKPTVADVTK